MITKAMGIIAPIEKSFKKPAKWYEVLPVGSYTYDNSGDTVLLTINNSVSNITLSKSLCPSETKPVIIKFESSILFHGADGVTAIDLSSSACKRHPSSVTITSNDPSDALMYSLSYPTIYGDNGIGINLSNTFCPITIEGIVFGGSTTSTNTNAGVKIESEYIGTGDYDITFNHCGFTGCIIKDITNGEKLSEFKDPSIIVTSNNNSRVLFSECEFDYINSSYEYTSMYCHSVLKNEGTIDISNSTINKPYHTYNCNDLDLIEVIYKGGYYTIYNTGIINISGSDIGHNTNSPAIYNDKVLRYIQFVYKYAIYNSGTLTISDNCEVYGDNTGVEAELGNMAAALEFPVIYSCGNLRVYDSTIKFSDYNCAPAGLTTNRGIYTILINTHAGDPENTSLFRNCTINGDYNCLNIYGIDYWWSYDGIAAIGILGGLVTFASCTILGNACINDNGMIWNVPAIKAISSGDKTSIELNSSCRINETGTRYYAIYKKYYDEETDNFYQWMGCVDLLTAAHDYYHDVNKHQIYIYELPNLAEYFSGNAINGLIYRPVNDSTNHYKYYLYQQNPSYSKRLTITIPIYFDTFRIALSNIQSSSSSMSYGIFGNKSNVGLAHGNGGLYTNLTYRFSASGSYNDIASVLNKVSGLSEDISSCMDNFTGDSYIMDMLWTSGGCNIYGVTSKGTELIYTVSDAPLLSEMLMMNFNFYIWDYYESSTRLSPPTNYAYSSSKVHYVQFKNTSKYLMTFSDYVYTPAIYIGTSSVMLYASFGLNEQIIDVTNAGIEASTNIYEPYFPEELIVSQGN